MSIRRPRFTIGRLMIAVAIFSCFFGLARIESVAEIVTPSVLSLVPTALAFLSPLLLAEPKQRLLAATWVAALWPLSFVVALHLVWAILYGYLGRPPGPADNGFLIEVGAGTLFFFMISALFASPATVILAGFAIMESVNAAIIPVLVMPISWAVVFSIANSDPVGAFVWFAD